MSLPACSIKNPPARELSDTTEDTLARLQYDTCHSASYVTKYYCHKYYCHKSACHEFTMNGDFVTHKNLGQKVLTENSLYNPGIQFADYALVAINDYLRESIVQPGN